MRISVPTADNLWFRGVTHPPRASRVHLAYRRAAKRAFGWAALCALAA